MVWVNAIWTYTKDPATLADGPFWSNRYFVKKDKRRVMRFQIIVSALWA